MKLLSMMARFWSELRRRRVIRTSIAYVVGVWVLVEASSVLFPALLLPEWSVRIVVAIAIVAFPMVIALAWMFDIERSTDSALGSVIVETRGSASAASESGPPLLNTAVASIAVLPLKNLSANVENEYLAEGISSELHSVLAKVHRVRVAARTSTFALRDSRESVKNIARELGVQYVVSGDVRCANEQMRVNICLESGIDGMQIWSETYDREIRDIFSIQQDIAEAVAGAFGGARLREEIASVASRPTDNLDAWSMVQCARSYVLAFTPQALEEAVPLLRKAIELDDEYAGAHAMLALVRAEQVLNGLTPDLDDMRDQAMKHAKRARALAPLDPFVLKTCGTVWAYFGAVDLSLEVLREAVRIAPFDFGAWGYLGWPLVATGQENDLEELHEIMNRILTITPEHPGAPYWLYHRSVASSCEGQDDSAVEFAREAVERNPAFPLGLLQYANALGVTGDMDAAAKAIDRCLELSPALTLKHYENMIRGMSLTDQVADKRLAGVLVTH